MKQFARQFAVWTFFSALALAPAHVRGAGGPDKYIVELKPGANAATVASRHGVAAQFVYARALNGFAGEIPPGQLERVKNDAQVQSVSPVRILTAIDNSANGKPSGGGSGSAEIVPEGVKRIGAAPGSLSVNGSGVGVAVVDTGIDYNHADLSVSPSGYSAFGGSAQDNHGHGTHVAGTIAAKANNGIGVVGVAPGATLYAVKVLDAAGNGDDAGVIAGLDWIAANANTVSPNIRVVNMSLGGPGSLVEGDPLRTAVQNLTASGISVVVAAGNDPKLTISQQVPAAYPEVMAIASTTAKSGASGRVSGRTYQIAIDTASYFTTDGAGVVVSAPGEDQEDVKNGGLLASVGILSTALGGGTTRMSGTSMASPHAAGVVALLWQEAISRGASITVDDARRRLRTGASGLGTAPKDSPTGSYTFDGEREGVLSAPGALAAP